MMLFVDGINQGVQCTNVGYWVDDHESAFRLLTGLVNQDWTLLGAVVCDDDECFCVPVEAFDGQPIDVHIRALETQWQRILSSHPPTFPTPTHGEFRDWLLALDAYYEEQVHHLRKMILCLEMRKYGLTKQRNQFFRLRVGQQYDSLLAINRRMLKKTEASRQRNRKRLEELQDNSNA